MNTSMLIQEQIDLTSLNTLHLKSTASHYLVLNNLDQLDELSAVLSKFSQFFVLGGGSNLIVPSVYKGLVIHNQLRGIEIKQQGDQRLVTAMAGENWDDFIAYCLSQEAFGLENLSLIPGTVGAAPIQNIGAYGVEVKDFIEQVNVYDLHTRQIICLNNSDCQFTYRNSILKNNTRYIVLSVCFKLSSKVNLNTNYGDVALKMASLENPTSQDLRDVVIEIRKSKLPNPVELGNAGSFFHNPVLPEIHLQNLLKQYPNIPRFSTADPEFIKVSAGWLIDNLGLKGLRKGNVGIYPKQALVLVNYGGACQTELLTFAEWIQDQVKAYYGVDLNIEPMILN